MIEVFFNASALIVSTISIMIAVYSCYQNYKINKIALRSYVNLYIVSTKNATYIKVKNFGKTSAKIINFKTDIDVDAAIENSNLNNFPLIGLENIYIAPGSSKIALIENKYLNCGHWFSVTWFDETTNKFYTHKIDLNSYNEYALVHEDDFEIIDF